MVGEYVEFTMLDTKGLGRVTIASSDSFQQFRLTNEAGGSQFSIHQLDGQPGIALRDTNDQQRLGVSLTKDGNGLIRYDNSSGGPVLSLSGDGDGTGGLHLYNLDGSSIVGSFITMDDGRPGFALFDRFGNIRVFLGVFQNGDAELQIRDSAGGIEALLP